MTSAAMAEALASILTKDQVLSGPAVERAYDCDAYSLDKSAPACVVLPASTGEVAKVVHWCISEGIPFTPRGAGTGLSGGSLPALGGVVISTKRMTSVLEIDVPNRCLHAQAGAVNRKLSEAVAKEGLHFAPDPSSQSVSTLGGNIAENSGGPHTLKYGVTAPHILALTLVSVTGEIVTLGSKVGGRPGPSLLDLVIGAEGTLGIVTEAWVRLTPLPREVKTALVAFPSVRSATDAVARIIGAGVIPAALEFMDRGILSALKAAFGLHSPIEAEALLLIECDSQNDPSLGDAAREIVEVEAICRQLGAIEFTLAKDDQERQKLWTARKKGIGAMGRIAPTIVTHDGVIPRSQLPDMLEFAYGVAAKYGLTCANLFHAGDGNLHPCFAFDDRVPGVVDKVIEAGEEILRKCIELGGSVSGEHGIGVEKLDLMPLMFSPTDLDLQGRVKAIFNEGNLGNPCKVLPNQRSCSEHRLRWRGASW